jgi:hypothetical protein
VIDLLVDMYADHISSRTYWLLHHRNTSRGKTDDSRYICTLYLEHAVNNNICSSFAAVVAWISHGHHDLTTLFFTQIRHHVCTRRSTDGLLWYGSEAERWKGLPICMVCFWCCLWHLRYCLFSKLSV